MSRICLYFRPPVERDRWFPGDRWFRPPIRRLLRGRPVPGGLERVFLNLCLGLDRIGVGYQVNLPFDRLVPGDRVAVLGIGREVLRGYVREEPILAGIGLMNHPREWPELFDDYPVGLYLQHSQWCAEVYREWFGDRCAVWAVGIDTDYWAPVSDPAKDVDLLVYDKVSWNRDAEGEQVLSDLRNRIAERGLRSAEIRYGRYRPEQYRALLRRSRGMVFASARESQGLAYQEALATGVPVLAWDPGARFEADGPRPGSRPTSIPYWDARCGEVFTEVGNLGAPLSHFLERVAAGAFAPRSYVRERLSLEGSAQGFLAHLELATAGVVSATLSSRS